MDSGRAQIQNLLKTIKLEDIMTRHVVTIHINAPFREVPQKFNEHGLRHLPVVDNSGRLAGLMTQRDLYKIQPPHKLMDGEWYYDLEMLDGIILSSVMIPQPFSMRPEDSVGEAIQQMVSHKYGCIFVVDENRVLRGIITQMDVLKLAARLYNGP
ncbi:MAG: CBS domain-containing protein [Candidatus Omnitrophota bacterium]|nr:CBS domain-containing protein [Candidatus Omnitrophota bacterium]